jgi:hypothetical protein
MVELVKVRSKLILIHRFGFGQVLVVLFKETVRKAAKDPSDG